MQGVERDIEEAVREFEVPGLACSIVEQGRVTSSRGYGVRAIGESASVDEHTLFAIGSVSKSFTAAAVAMLVDAGEIAWDSKVIDHLPSFQLHDPYVTRELTIRDLLVHRSGLERGDFMWYKSGYGTDEVLSRVRHLAPSWGFRTTFGYQNIMYAAAGEIIHRASGISWDDFIMERLLKPLGMTRSRPHVNRVDRGDNLALSHAEIDGAVRLIPPDEGTNSNAAGSIYSSVHDMTQWLQLNLSDGSLGDRRLLTTGSLSTVQTPQMLIAYTAPWSGIFPDASFLSYGMGWFICSYRGRKVISHGGNIDGMTAAACVVPEIGFGICVLANLDGTSLPQALVYHALDRALGDGSRVRLAQFRKNELVAKERLAFARAQRERERIPATAPSRPLEEYAGVYGDPYYGTATLTRRDDALWFDFIGWKGALEHFQLDTFRLRAGNAVLTKYDPMVRFTLDDYGNPSEVTLTLLSTVRMRLTRVPEEPKAIELSAEERAAFVGVYACDAPRTVIRIESLGEALKATLPGSLTGAPSEYVVADLIATAPSQLRVRGSPLELRFGGARGGRGRAELRIPHQPPVVLERGRSTDRG